MCKNSQEERLEGKKEGLGWGIHHGVTCFCFLPGEPRDDTFSSWIFNFVWMILCCGDCPVHSRTLSNIPGLTRCRWRFFSLPTSCDRQKCPNIVKCPPVVEWPDKVRNTYLNEDFWQIMNYLWVHLKYCLAHPYAKQILFILNLTGCPVFYFLNLAISSRGQNRLVERIITFS